MLIALDSGPLMGIGDAPKHRPIVIALSTKLVNVSRTYFDRRILPSFSFKHESAMRSTKVKFSQHASKCTGSAPSPSGPQSPANSSVPRKFFPRKTSFSSPSTCAFNTAKPVLLAASFSKLLARVIASLIAVTHRCIVVRSSASTTSAALFPPCPGIV